MKIEEDTLSLWASSITHRGDRTEAKPYRAKWQTFKKNLWSSFSACFEWLKVRIPQILSTTTYSIHYGFWVFLVLLFDPLCMFFSFWSNSNFWEYVFALNEAHTCHVPYLRFTCESVEYVVSSRIQRKLSKMIKICVIFIPEGSK